MEERTKQGAVIGVVVTLSIVVVGALIGIGAGAASGRYALVLAISATAQTLWAVIIGWSVWRMTRSGVTGLSVTAGGLALAICGMLLLMVPTLPHAVFGAFLLFSIVALSFAGVRWVKWYRGRVKAA